MTIRLPSPCRNATAPFPDIEVALALPLRQMRIMSSPSPEKDAEIARLLGQLADLSDEEAALEAYRREAESFDPEASTESISRALLVLAAERTPS